MKQTLLYIFAGLVALIGMTACSPDEFEHPNEAGIPTISEAIVKATVDQTTNTVTFTMDNDGCYPVWMIPSGKNTVYSTVNGLKKIFATAGEYTVEYRIGNANGISQGTGTVTFTIENSIVDYDQYYTMISGGVYGAVAEKEWRIDNTQAAHLACGPSGSDGTSWWSAQPNEKASTGLYDNRLTFNAEGAYTFDPGASGTMYVNTGCTIFPDYHQAEDFTVPVDLQTTSYSFAVEGADLYLVLPAETQFPYIANDAQWSSPRFRIENITSSQIDLVYDNGEIAWHYILVSGGEGFDGYDYTSTCNLWNSATISQRFWYAPGWSQIADPTCEVDGNSYKLTFPNATTDQWQAQCFWETDMTTNSVTNYDFSCHFMANADHKNVTVKLFKKGEDNTFFFTENISLKAYEEYVFYMSDMPGLDIDNVSLVLDFGGCPDNFEVTVSKIDLQEHACDGIVAPEKDEDQTVYDYDSEMNLWRTMVDATADFSTTFWYAPGWSQIDDPEFTFDNGTYTVVLPYATTDQWQAQMHLITNIAATAETPYDFCCTLYSTTAQPGVTVKMTDTSSDDNYFFTERVALNAYEEYTLKVPAKSLSKDAAALKLVFDFGGCPDNSVVSISKIVFQKTAL